QQQQRLALAVDLVVVAHTVRLDVAAAVRRRPGHRAGRGLVLLTGCDRRCGGRHQRRGKHDRRDRGTPPPRTAAARELPSYPEHACLLPGFVVPARPRRVGARTVALPVRRTTGPDFDIDTDGWA